MLLLPDHRHRLHLHLSWLRFAQGGGDRRHAHAVRQMRLGESARLSQLRSEAMLRVVRKVHTLCPPPPAGSGWGLPLPDLRVSAGGPSSFQRGADGHRQEDQPQHLWTGG